MSTPFAADQIKLNGTLVTTENGGLQVDGNPIISADGLLVEYNYTDNHTLVIGDAAKGVTMDKATAVNLTVPPNSSVPFPVGTQVPIFSVGVGIVTIIAGSGVTIQSDGNMMDISGQNRSAVLWKRATNTWLLIGQLA